MPPVYACLSFGVTLKLCAEFPAFFTASIYYYGPVYFFLEFQITWLEMHGVVFGESKKAVLTLYLE